MKVSSDACLGTSRLELGRDSAAAGTNESASAAASKLSWGFMRRARDPGVEGRSAMVLEAGRRVWTRASISGDVREWVTSIAVMWRFGRGMSQRAVGGQWKREIRGLCGWH